MTMFRTQKTHDAYEQAKARGHLTSGVCRMCEDETLVEFTNWRIITNLFPYDNIAQTHHLLIPKRHVIEQELTAQEVAELHNLKETKLNDTYTFIFEPLPKQKSIPQHFHLHLIVPY